MHAENAPRTRKRLLVVEDNPVFLDLFVAVFGRLHEVRPAMTAEEGERACRGWRPDLVLLDAVLPGQTGLEFLRTLRAPGGGAARAPVIIVTAAMLPAALREALAREPNVVGYLTKDLGLDPLRGLVEAALANLSPAWA